MGMLGVADDKHDQVLAALSAAGFGSVTVGTVQRSDEWSCDDIVNAVAMGPSAFHTAPEALRERPAHCVTASAVTVTLTAVDVTRCPERARKRTPGVGWGEESRATRPRNRARRRGGQRLYPLTADRAKPAVPFGAPTGSSISCCRTWSTADTSASACSTQYKSHRWTATSHRPGGRVGFHGEQHHMPVPAQQRLGKRWFTGSADAILQKSLNPSTTRSPTTRRLGADHVYRMDPSRKWWLHTSPGRGCNGGRDPRAARGGDGAGLYRRRRVRAHHPVVEKPADPPATPDDPTMTLASMGNYVHHRRAHRGAARDSADEDSDHDMGGNIIPLLASKGEAAVYDFRDNEVPGATERDRGYWRDGDDRRLLRRPYGPGVAEPGLHPLQPPLADPGETSNLRRRRNSSSAARCRTRWSVPDRS